MRFIAAVSVLTLAAAGAAFAADFSIDGAVIGHPWSRPAAAGGNAAGYMTITNSETTPLILSSITAPKAAGGAEIHQSTIDANGIASMKSFPNGVIIPPRSTFRMEPGGYHIMMTNLSAPTTVGERMIVILNFKRGEMGISTPIQIDIEAGSPTADAK